MCVAAVGILLLKVYKNEINEWAGPDITAKDGIKLFTDESRDIKYNIDPERASELIDRYMTRTVDCTVYRAKTKVCLKWEAAMRELSSDYEFMSPGSHAVVEMYFFAMQKKEELIEAYHKCMSNKAHKVSIGFPGHLYKFYSKGMDEELFRTMLSKFSVELFEAGQRPVQENP